MFSPTMPNRSEQTASLNSACDSLSRIQGGGLVQVIVTSLLPLNYYLFINDQIVPSSEVESLSVHLEASEDGNPKHGTLRATLSRHVQTPAGEKRLQQIPLFPCTFQVIAQGRRLSVTCTHPQTLEGVWLHLGMQPDGSSAEVRGAKSLRFLLTGGILDAKLTWFDGRTTDLIPY
jgi:hypothetical protein